MRRAPPTEEINRRLVKYSTAGERRSERDEIRPTPGLRLRFLHLKSIMLVSPPPLHLWCPLPGRWMALVTVQRSPTPSTTSSPCVSVRVAFYWTPRRDRRHGEQTQTYLPSHAVCRLRFRCLFPPRRLPTIMKCLAFTGLRMREIWPLIVVCYIISVVSRC